MNRGKRPVLSDRELVRMLEDDPELLAIADALTQTQAGRTHARNGRVGALVHLATKTGQGKRLGRSPAPSIRGGGVMRRRFTVVALGGIVALAALVGALGLAS